ncbi:uncharacterized protein LOC9652349 [Selaginella moellendorffii]|uniref:uncharacterized protein LOC9652349 n=1 Tax=Selaginella moellendorffii TaxID=88036 RepID=UPI000D1C3F15|nr:uncharacterized protein LOC9652349 [Selaginella moellendorffii]|eukprot:XP_024526930.1 uncharacterized protein LOC9652349 [Selaginella moellendorffii]
MIAGAARRRLVLLFACFFRILLSSSSLGESEERSTQRETKHGQEFCPGAKARFDPGMLVAGRIMGSISARELLEVAQQRIAAALDEASSVKTFLGRWRIIQFRLEKLGSQLHDMSKCPLLFLESYSLCTEVLESMVATIEDAKISARKCLQSGQIDGKLQMQSALDALAARFHHHIHDCDVVIKNSLVKESMAALLLVTGSRASRSRSMVISGESALRWAVRDLVVRLQIETDPRSKHRALASIVDLLEGDDKNAVLVASQGGIPALVRLLDAGMPCAVRERAASAVYRLARASCCEQELIAENALPPLVRLLESGTGLAKECAVSALHCLTYTPENARSLAAHGGVAALVQICRYGTPLAQASAAGAIKNLAGVTELRTAIAEEDGLSEGAVAVLLGLVLSGTDAARDAASDALQILAEAYGATHGGRLGDVEAILRFLSSFPPPQGRRVAVRMLRNISRAGGVAGTAAYNALAKLGDENGGEESDELKLTKMVSKKKLSLGKMVMALLTRKIATASSSSSHENRLKSFFLKRW